MLATLSSTIGGLMDAASQLQEDAPGEEQLQAIIAHGEFRPAEDEAIGFWFARFLTLRDSLWTIINDTRAVLYRPTVAIDEKDELRYFLIGYAAVCILIRLDRLMLFEVAHHSLIQRKLNESFPEYRIPRKQYTQIFSAFVDQSNVLAIRDAMVFARKNRRKLLKLRDDEHVGFIVRQLRELESSLNKSKRSYLKRAWSYISHKWRRRGVVTVEKLFAGVLEGCGRAISEFYEADNKRVTKPILDSIGSFLQPGDVIVTRHAKALSNLFFPGFWPHAALYVGTEQQRRANGISAAQREELWTGDICVLEAQKDGVLLRPLRKTLTVDTFVVLRPNLSPQSICQAVERALLHEGKRYNFDFDFFNSDRIVCTELIYRAYDGIEELEFPLRERAGRKTFSAEDLLDFALETKAFTPVALFGVDKHQDAVLYDGGVRAALIATYRQQT